ncbi:MAG TPA: serine hydrolase domain-containing protein [Roseiflexaceae bacterium]|nr:serine hydrolase domain-containing protein [Roseiflexaceae bacterium]
MTLITEAPESVGMSAQRLERIKPVMQSYVNQRGFAGVSTMIARRGRIVHFDQVGWRDKEAQLPMTADTIVRIYSMTKPVVCTALMMLYEEGRFQLLEPVAKYLPAFGGVKVLAADGTLIDPVRPITIRDLMAHTSGLTYDFLEDSPVAELYRQARLMSDGTRSLEAVIGELARLPLAYQPGSRWHYSLGIDVAAHLIQVLSGQPLGVFLHERVFAPLGMVDTAFGVPEAQRGRLAAMYGHPDIAGENISISHLVQAFMTGDNQRRDLSATYPANAPKVFQRGGHGLFSTAQDYIRFAQMLLNGGQLDDVRLIGRKTLELMHTNHVPAALLPIDIAGLPNPGLGFGLGSRVALNMAEMAVPGSVGEYGWSGAAKTYYWVDPKEELIGLLLTQYMFNFDLIEQDFRVLAYQAIVD